MYMYTYTLFFYDQLLQQNCILKLLLQNSKYSNWKISGKLCFLSFVIVAKIQLIFYNNCNV